MKEAEKIYIVVDDGCVIASCKKYNTAEVIKNKKYKEKLIQGYMFPKVYIKEMYLI